MRIWLINNYNMLPEHGHLNRNYYLGKYLTRQGHDVTVFAGSHPHSTKLQLIEGRERYRVFREKPFPWVLIKIRNYEGSRISRVVSMFEFYANMMAAAKHFDKPDAVVGSSAHPLAALLAIRLGKKYGCKGIVEIRDLWPESIVAYGIAGRNNPVVRLLYRFEKYLYKRADAVVFTMENAYRYIEDRGWAGAVPKEKVFYVNNGVDLEEFRANAEQNPSEDELLSDPELFKIVYTGSIRKVNNLGLLLDAAKLVKDPRVRILIWGGGDERPALVRRAEEEGIANVSFRGEVAKKYIPGIVSRADAALAHNENSPIFRYGISFNKLFDYLAGGHPVLCDFTAGHNPAVDNGAGITCGTNDPREVARMIDDLASMRREELEALSENARKTAEAYSYDNLARKLATVIETA